MYASAASLALMGLLSSSVVDTTPAAAVPMNTGPSAIELGYTPIIRHLDSNGHLVWTETDGGHVTHFSNEVANKAIQNMTTQDWSPSNTNKALEKRWSGWTNIGQIAAKSAKYACIDSGAWISDGVVSSLYDKACEQFVSKTPVGLSADRAWTVYKAISDGTNGKSKRLNFRYFDYNTDANDKLTKAMCTTVYKQLTSNLCQGKDEHGTDSQGGTGKVKGR
ncbi:MAG: hypothetical protein Q9168_006431 [Polycauliona sp. 1 TL-2023]